MADARICAVKDCCNPVRTRDWCSKHYQRLIKFGRPDFPVRRIPAPGEVREWVQRHLSFSGKECLPWPFSKCDNGRGQAVFRNRNIVASRMMCILVHGEPPFVGAKAAHNCGNGHNSCVNPSHLRWDTHSGNMADRIAHGTDARGEKSVRAKLSNQQAAHILASKGQIKQSILAEENGVTIASISAIQRRKSWAWLPEQNIIQID